MKAGLFKYAALAILLAGAAGCSQSATQPTATTSVPTQGSAAVSSTTTSSGTVGTSSVTLTTPTLVTPADGLSVKYADQPLTLTVANAVSTGTAARTYNFQVATDAAFNTIASSRSGVAEGANGETAVVIDKLAGSATYFWRAQAAVGGQIGAYTKARSFTVGPQIVLGTPVLASPGSNATVTGSAVLTVNNITRTGPVGTIAYRFDVSDSSAFSHIVYTTSVSEQSGNVTSATIPTSSLTTGTTYFWRVQAVDPPSGITSAMSAWQPFQYIAFDMTKAIIVDSPYDLGYWAVTANITSIDFADNILVDFDRRDGPNRWPDTPWGAPGDSVSTASGCASTSATSGIAPPRSSSGTAAISGPAAIPGKLASTGSIRPHGDR